MVSNPIPKGSGQEGEDGPWKRALLVIDAWMMIKFK
jgi:hypothetical protein